MEKKEKSTFRNAKTQLDKKIEKSCQQLWKCYNPFFSSRNPQKRRQEGENTILKEFLCIKK